eukprot:GHVU01115553.1.p2 GENE.GHVU01115553.1~~GHVU01115553.1.p2  ORF type:complete len:185 (+),score=0.11 GHVU01115553.1:457-1011(+)
MLCRRIPSMPQERRALLHDGTVVCVCVVKRNARRHLPLTASAPPPPAPPRAPYNIVVAPVVQARIWRVDAIHARTHLFAESVANIAPLVCVPVANTCLVALNAALYNTKRIGVSCVRRPGGAICVRSHFTCHTVTTATKIYAAAVYVLRGWLMGYAHFVSGRLSPAQKILIIGVPLRIVSVVAQ